MEAYDAYVMYLALKRHFTVGSNYDYFKYNGKTNASKQSFDTRKDKYSFHKLSKRNNPKDFLISNFLKFGPNIWIGDLTTESKYEDAYADWQKRKESLSYSFKNDIEQIEDVDRDLTSVDGDYPRLLQLYMRNKVSIETLIILSRLLGFLNRWNKDISDPVIWPEIYNTCVKYEPFIEYDREKMKTILMETLWSN
jgi:T4 gene Gp59 loader of gp41 DNA helicase/T4 gene Gp59 loader of gp41 DNA helicase C-term